ncbi:hypothetical protein LTR08_001140 [Meristemomyces frigidus]|nr:hypothetical protein LTR08_001140 [Meristemomyces frigidus]
MPSRIDDRWVWLGFTIFLSIAAVNIRHCIHETVRLTEVDPNQLEDDEAQNEEQPEDSITLATLKTLIDSPNPSISNAAIALAVTRFGRTPHAPETLVECYSLDDRQRHEARTIVHYLKDWPVMDRRRGEWSDGEGEGDGQLEEIDWSPDGVLVGANATNDARGNDHVDGFSNRNDSVEEGEMFGWNYGLPLVQTGTPDVGGDAGAEFSEAERAANIAQTNGIVEAMERRRRNRVAMVLHEGDGFVEEGDIYRPG